MLKYSVITVSIVLNIIFIIFFLTSDNNITKMYSTTLEGTPKYKERIEQSNGDIIERILIDGDLIQEVIYFPNGQKKEIKNYKNNQKHGDWIIYYQNNDSINKKRKMQYSNYRNDLLRELVKYDYSGSIQQLSLPISKNSKMITNYYLNGQIESSGKIFLTQEGEEKRYGTWIWYDEAGLIKQEKLFN